MGGKQRLSLLPGSARGRVAESVAVDPGNAESGSRQQLQLAVLAVGDQAVAEPQGSVRLSDRYWYPEQSHASSYVNLSVRVARGGTDFFCSRALRETRGEARNFEGRALTGSPHVDARRGAEHRQREVEPATTSDLNGPLADLRDRKAMAPARREGPARLQIRQMPDQQSTADCLDGLGEHESRVDALVQAEEDNGGPFGVREPELHAAPNWSLLPLGLASGRCCAQRRQYSECLQLRSAMPSRRSGWEAAELCG